MISAKVWLRQKSPSPLMLICTMHILRSVFYEHGFYVIYVPQRPNQQMELRQ